MRLLEPEHTVESVARALVAGLENGSIVLARVPAPDGERVGPESGGPQCPPDELLREAFRSRARGRYQEALVFYAKVLETDPANEEARVGSAVALGHLDEPNNYQPAIVRLQQVIAGNPASALAYYNMACLKLLATNRHAGTYPTAEIVRDLRAAIALDPGVVVTEADPTFSTLRDDPEFTRALREPSDHPVTP